MDRSVSPLSARSQSVELFSLNMWQQNICAFGLWFCLHMRKIQESSLLGIVIEWWKQFLEYWCLCHSCFISLLKMMCRLYFLSELWCMCSWVSPGFFHGGEDKFQRGEGAEDFQGCRASPKNIQNFWFLLHFWPILPPIFGPNPSLPSMAECIPRWFWILSHPKSFYRILSQSQCFFKLLNPIPLNPNSGNSMQIRFEHLKSVLNHRKWLNNNPF